MSNTELKIIGHLIALPLTLLFAHLLFKLFLFIDKMRKDDE